MVKFNQDAMFRKIFIQFRILKLGSKSIQLLDWFCQTGSQLYSYMCITTSFDTWILMTYVCTVRSYNRLLLSALNKYTQKLKFIQKID